MPVRRPPIPPTAITRRSTLELSSPLTHADSDYLNSELNEVLVDRFRTGIFDEGDLDLADEILSRDFTAHIPGFPAEWLKGPEGIKQMATAMRDAFPDVGFSYGVIFARGGKVVLQWTMTGTHRGEIFGVAPTGKFVSFTGTDIFLVSPTGPGGRIAEMWTSWDQWGLLQQLDALPPS